MMIMFYGGDCGGGSRGSGSMTLELIMSVKVTIGVVVAGAVTTATALIKLHSYYTIMVSDPSFAVYFQKKKHTQQLQYLLSAPGLQ
jgi:hypothetical protein